MLSNGLTSIFSHDLYEVLTFRILSILSVPVPVYCNVFFFIFFFPLPFQMYSSASVCFWFLILFMVKIYVLGGPYLLCLDFMIYIFIGVHRCSINSELPSDLSSGFIVFTYPYISISIFPAYLPATCLHKSFCPYYIHWFVPFSLYSDFMIPISSLMAHWSIPPLSCFILFLIRVLNFTCPLALTSFFLFSFGIFSSAHWSIPL